MLAFWVSESAAASCTVIVASLHVSSGFISSGFLRPRSRGEEVLKPNLHGIDGVEVLNACVTHPAVTARIISARKSPQKPVGITVCLLSETVFTYLPVDLSASTLERSQSESQTGPSVTIRGLTAMRKIGAGRGAVRATLPSPFNSR
eukprot:CAMPEP_0180155068 /NCGR_PEP_ID=MMETSP0986-20121125/24571_1 /TAXON_ID=697907 /ORGANISM="non described non described, Strain CCMP2293" /LENGTH=146 /DNA_ID=CAMNT_0022103617 /DNA_START=71 /DNA_END=511 /DNA_ORIENTATION=-